VAILLIFVKQEAGDQEATQHEKKIDAHPAEVRDNGRAFGMTAENQQNRNGAEDVKSWITHPIA
jgi:hypothetical protein